MPSYMKKKKKNTTEKNNWYIAMPPGLVVDINSSTAYKCLNQIKFYHVLNNFSKLDFTFYLVAFLGQKI